MKAQKLKAVIRQVPVCRLYYLMADHKTLSGLKQRPSYQTEILWSGVDIKASDFWPDVPAVVVNQVELFSIVHVCLLDVSLVDLLSLSSAVLHSDFRPRQRVSILLILTPDTQSFTLWWI